MDSLDKHLSEISKRTLTGSVAEQVKAARDGLWSMKHHPEIAFKCGPYGLRMLAKAISPSLYIAAHDIVKKAASTTMAPILRKS